MSLSMYFTNKALSDDSALHIRTSGSKAGGRLKRSSNIKQCFSWSVASKHEQEGAHYHLWKDHPYEKRHASGWTNWRGDIGMHCPNPGAGHSREGGKRQPPPCENAGRLAED